MLIPYKIKYTTNVCSLIFKEQLLLRNVSQIQRASSQYGTKRPEKGTGTKRLGRNVWDETSPARNVPREILKVISDRLQYNHL